MNYYYFFFFLNAQLQAPLGKPCLVPGSKIFLMSQQVRRCAIRCLSPVLYSPPSSPFLADWLAVPNGWAVEWGLATWPTGKQHSPLTAFQAVPSLQNACLCESANMEWNSATNASLKSCKGMTRISSALRNI